MFARPRRQLAVLALMSWALAVCGAGHAAAAPAGALPPVESFFENPAFSDAALSPNARFLAAKLSRAGQRDALVVIDLATNGAKVAAVFADMDVGDFYWVNNERLVYNAREKDLAQGDTHMGPGLFAVNRDGTGYRQLVTRSARVLQEHAVINLLPYNTYLLRQRGAQDSASIYVRNTKYAADGEIELVNLQRLDTQTGRAVTVNRPADTRSWLLDQKGEPRLAQSLEKEMSVVYYRDPGTDKWRKLAQFNTYTGDADEIEPIAFGPDGALYVAARGGRDKTALYRFDVVAGKRDPEPIVELKDYDFSGHLLFANDKLLGVRVLSDARSTVWFDAGMKALQQRIDSALPATVNMVTPAARAETAWVLVESYSDVQPPIWHLFNAETGAFNKVGESYPNIDPRQMGIQEALRYKARDGLEIPAWLTLPHGSKRKNLPLVVLVHGGPYVRGGEWGFDPDTQFLASRGYAVLEPEYRGSTGFGTHHFRAGWKQWGLKMQDDIADGVKWAIAQGIADPKRICIAGASYGGYATLMGLLNDPDLYRCGVDWVGVTDIDLMYTGHWSFFSDMPESYKRYGMPTLIGDRVKDAAQLRATSPLAQAARITRPLLLAYGGNDYRVPIYHGRQFYDAIKEHNPHVEMVVYEEEGHGWYLPKNRIDFWRRVEKFLDRNIGEPAPKQGPALLPF
ncbi:MAG: dipeptidyl aminopeptidase [Massilia sp.]|nr:dipeptidyl aminopeptidase [Massilia sp.]